MQPQYQPMPSRRLKSQKKKRKRKLPLLLSLIVFMAIACAAFLFGTNSGNNLREMLGGSILSSQHPQYAKLLLSQAEIDKLKKIIFQPQSVSSSLNRFSKHFAGNAPLVKVETIETSHYTAKIMLVSDPTAVHLVASKYKTKGQALSELIEQNHGIAGINAGGFSDAGGTGSGGQVVGIAIGDGHVLSDPRFSWDERQLVGGFTSDGQFITGSYSIHQLQAKGVTEAVSFGPQLIVDRKNRVTKNIQNAYGWAPRTAIGQREDGTVIMIITDGRFYHNKTHRGASMMDIVDLFQRFDAVNAIALDGGGSTTMINNGVLQLQPATQTRAGMRYLPNAFIVIPRS